jgi:hypothetical protein
MQSESQAVPGRVLLHAAAAPAEGIVGPPHDSEPDLRIQTRAKVGSRLRLAPKQSSQAA